MVVLAEKLQFRTYKLWQTTGDSKETKGRSAFIGLQEETREGCFEFPLVGNDRFEAVEVYYWQQAVAVAEERMAVTEANREGNFLLPIDCISCWCWSYKLQ